jgi:hypothetical protein
MSHAFTLSDEQYAIIKAAADASGRTPEDLFLAWAMDEEARYRLAHPTYYETDEWLRHLGVSDERIERADQTAAQEDAADADA